MTDALQRFKWGDRGMLRSDCGLFVLLSQTERENAELRTECDTLRERYAYCAENRVVQEDVIDRMRTECAALREVTKAYERSLVGAVLIRAEKLTELNAECAALRAAVRDWAIRERTTSPVKTRWVCLECETQWESGAPERHADGCLAAPRLAVEGERG